MASATKRFSDESVEPGMRVQESQIEDRLPPEAGGTHTGLATAGRSVELGVAAAQPQPSRLHLSLKSVLRKSYALDLLSRITARDRVEILLYHGFCPGSRSDPRFPRLMPIREFEEHIRTCTRYLPPLSLDQALRPGASGVVVTFDDGYANNFKLAFPVLQKYQFPATIFLTTGFLDQSTPLWSNWLEFLVMNAPACDTVFNWQAIPIALPLAGSAPRVQILAGLSRWLHLLPVNEIHRFLRTLEAHLHTWYDWHAVPDLLQPLSWDEVRIMRRSGLVSFGCHTVSHPVLSRCSREVQTFEIHDSKRRIERELGEECTAFAYPFGKHMDYTEVTGQIVKDAGFDLALTAESGSTRPSSCNPYEVRRWGADLGVDELSFLVSGGPLISGSIKGRGRH